MASAGFLSDLAIDVFWMEVEAFEHAVGNQCFQELALGCRQISHSAHIPRSC